MVKEEEKRSSELGIGVSVSPACRADGGVGGRQEPGPQPARGGGYQDNCMVLNFEPTPEKKRDPRLDELQAMGLQRIWIDIGEKIGVDTVILILILVNIPGTAAHDHMHF